MLNTTWKCNYTLVWEAYRGYSFCSLSLQLNLHVYSYASYFLSSELISVLNGHLQVISSDNPAPGLVRFGGEGSNIQVPVKWLEVMQGKTTRAESSCAMKRYIDRFFNPWDLQGLNSSIVAQMTGEKKELFNALECTKISTLLDLNRPLICLFNLSGLLLSLHTDTLYYSLLNCYGFWNIGTYCMHGLVNVTIFLFCERVLSLGITWHAKKIKIKDAIFWSQLQSRLLLLSLRNCIEINGEVLSALNICQDSVRLYNHNSCFMMRHMIRDQLYHIQACMIHFKV